MIDIKKISRWRNPINHMAVAYRKKAVFSVGLYPDIKFKEDYALWLKMIASNKKIINIPKVLVDATVGSEMYSRRTGLGHLKSELDLLKFRFFLENENKVFAILSFIIRSCFGLVFPALKKHIYFFLRKIG